MAKSTAWFDRGVAAVQRIAQIDLAEIGLAGKYICPLCIRGFDRKGLSYLSREDAPPRRLDGRRLALTCRECNSGAGSDLDVHMVAEDNFLRGWTSRPLVSQIVIGDVSANVELSVEKPEIRVANFRRRNSPATSNALAQELDTICGKKIELKIRLDHDSRLAQIGWLRSAYIIAFAALGYTYILQPSLDVVRRQFQDPEGRLLDRFYGASGDGSRSTRRLGRTLDGELDLIIVQVGERVMLLPGFSPEVDVYAELSNGPKTKQLSCKLEEIPWPSEPMHALDTEDDRPLGLPLELRSRPQHRASQG